MAVIAKIPFTRPGNDHYYATFEEHVEFYDFDVGKAIPKKEHDYLINLHLVPHYLNQLEALIASGSPKDGWTFHVFGTASATSTTNRNDEISLSRATAIGNLIKQRIDQQKKRSPITADCTFAVGPSGKGDAVAKTQLEAAKRANPGAHFSDRVVEKAQWMQRGAFTSLNVIDNKRVLPPVPKDPTQEFGIRQVEQVSFNKSLGPGGIAGVTIDFSINFEIRDHLGSIACYRYSGIGPSAGVPVFDLIFKVFSKVAKTISSVLGKGAKELDDGEKALMWLMKKAFGDKDPEVLAMTKRLLPSRIFDFIEKVWSNGTAATKQISKGPFQSFNNRCPLKRRSVGSWDGEMQVTQYGVITNYPEWLLGTAPAIIKDLGNTILNFGGIGVVIPEMKPGYAAHIEEFDSGQALFPGLLQVTSTMGALQFLQMGDLG